MKGGEKLEKASESQVRRRGGLACWVKESARDILKTDEEKRGVERRGAKRDADVEVSRINHELQENMTRRSRGCARGKRNEEQRRRVRGVTNAGSCVKKH